MKRRPGFISIWAHAALLATFFSSAASAVTVVHTNDIMGDIEPCGCRNNPLGGLVRKETLLKGLKDREILQLDAGDFFFPTNSIPDLLAAQSTLQAEHLLKIHEELKQDAIVPGEKDFALGLKFFEKLIKGSKVQFLAANLQRKTGSLLLKPSAVFTRKDANGKAVKIGVIGLVGDDLRWPKELKATSAVQAAKKELQKLKAEKVDYIIALTHQGLEKDDALAQTVPGIDLIIGAHTQSFLQTPAKIGNALVLQSSFRNQYVGTLPLTRPIDVTQYKLTALDAGFDPSPDSPGKAVTLTREFKEAVAKVNSKSLSKSEIEAPLGAGQTLFQTFPRCAECHSKQFDFWRQTQHMRGLSSLVEKNQLKNKECLSCHTLGLGNPHGFSDLNRMAEIGDKTMPPEELETFLKSVHEAKTLDSPIKLRKTDKNTVSVKQSLGTLMRVWAPIQCENCHSPGREHPFGGTYTKEVKSVRCIACHTAERAPSWYSKSGEPNKELIAAKMKLIACPAGDLAPEDDSK